MGCTGAAELVAIVAHHPLMTVGHGVQVAVDLRGQYGLEVVRTTDVVAHAQRQLLSNFCRTVTIAGDFRSQRKEERASAAQIFDSAGQVQALIWFVATEPHR